MSEEKTHLFDRPENVRRVLRLLYLVCALLLAADLFINRHAVHSWESLTGFYALYGFIACTLLVLTAKWLRKLLKRDEDYYDRR